MHYSDLSAVLGAVVLAIGGGLAGHSLSKHRYWSVTFGIFLALFLIILILKRIPFLYYQFSFSWVGQGHIEPLAFSFLLPAVFGMLIPRLKIPRQRLMVWVLAAVGTGYLGVMPFVESALVRQRLQGLETWREDGICLQTTEFTCGPAAAVTSLHQLGLQAEESELAIAACTTPSRGTSVGQLANAIESLFSDQGVKCRFVRFSSVEQMHDLCPVIVTVKYRFMIDHFVTVLAVEDDTVVLADPLKGTERLSYEDFCCKWRRIGIVVTRR